VGAAAGSLIVLLFAAVAILSLAAGGLIGWHARGNRELLAAAVSATSLPAAPPPAATKNATSLAPPATAPPPSAVPTPLPTIEAAKVREMLARIHQLADNAAAGVGEHSSRVERISQEISELTADGETPLEQVILGAAARLVEANDHLEQELASAKTQLEAHAKQIEAHMAEARTDGLVGVANRRAFDEELARQCSSLEQEGKPFYLLLLDVDHFKQFNDRHGHQAGDEVLRGVGRILAESAREQDFVARYGGEEFAILVPDVALDEAQLAAEHFRSAVEAGKFEYEGLQLQVTASFGLAEAAAGQAPETLIQRADEALYAAKKNGRNRAFYFNGKTCEAVDPGRLTPRQAPADVAQAPTRGAPAASNRRGHSRRPFRTQQLVAPYIDGRMPSPTMFRTVQCFDISSSGFSYLLDEPAAHQALIVALGVPPDITYLTARVEHSTMKQEHPTPLFLIGCRFTGRVELPDGAIATPNAEG
jgi:diguanylate cyclase (GGDEF)-like protein